MARPKVYMKDSAEILDLTEDEKKKARHILEVAQDKFKSVNITVSELEIVLKGNDYEEIINCKRWFEIKIGRRNIHSQRRSTACHPGGDGLYTTRKRHAYTKYITYERIRVIVVEGDLIEFDENVDCYVNPTNCKLEHKSEISNTLKKYGRMPYERACEISRPKAAKLKTTQCLITNAGMINTKYVIHALCPTQMDYIFSKKDMKNDIFLTVFNCLEIASEDNIQSIALSFLCTGHGQLDINVCSQQYAFAVLEFSRLRKSRSVVNTVYFIDRDETKVVLVNKVFSKILPSTEMQLLEIPKQGYSDCSTSIDTATTSSVNDDCRYHMDHASPETSGEVDGKTTILYSRQSQNDSCRLLDEETDQTGIGHMEHASPETSGEVDGKTTVLYRRQSQNDSCRLLAEETDQTGIGPTYTTMENEANQQNQKEPPFTRIIGNTNTCMMVTDPYSHLDKTDRFENNGSDNARDSVHSHQTEQKEIHTFQEMSEFREKIGNYDIVFERGDIRNSEMEAIVCPENVGEERGGLLAAAIKCTFRQSFDPKKLKKVQKNDFATTEHKNKSGFTQYIFHVQTAVWTKDCDEKELEESLKETMEMIFDKLRRQKKRNIRSISIPLLGINSVENIDAIVKCCKWQIWKTMEILQRKDEIKYLQEIRLINRCERIRNILLNEMKALLARKPVFRQRREYEKI